MPHTRLKLTVGGAVEWEFAIKTQILLSGERVLDGSVSVSSTYNGQYFFRGISAHRARYKH